MTRRAFLGLGAVGRRGITLVEILISILIMGVGMLSLATLFPLGLERIRRANRASRSALLTESAGDQVASRNLLLKDTFKGTWFLNWPSTLVPQSSFTTRVDDTPFTRDPDNPIAPSVPVLNGLGTAYIGTDSGIDRLHPNANILNGSPLVNPGGPGLPICYDPLWWYQMWLTTGITPATQWKLGSATQPGPGTRFGNGIGLVGLNGQDASGGGSRARGASSGSRTSPWSTA